VLVACRVEPDDAEPVGAAVLGGSVPVLALEHLWVRPDLRGQGFGRAIEELVRTYSAGRGATVLAADVPSDVPALVALARGSRVLGQYLTRPVDADAPLPAGFGWRPMTDEEFAPWRERQVQAYADDNLARSGGDRDRALERSRADFARALPDGLDTTGTTLVVLTVEGDQVGHLWLRHHRPGRETFGYDLEVVPTRRREGWGRAAIALAARLAAEAGDTVLGLHVFGDNDGARALYASAGFEVRSTKHDLLARA
jgi:GNAT superfamily N-acetyltransferase